MERKALYFESVRTEKNPDLWTVGLRFEDGSWYPESDYLNKNHADFRSKKLNQGIVHPDWFGDQRVPWFDTITLP